MQVEQLLKLHKAEPFRPFRIHLADGRHLEVQHPEFLAYTPKGRTAVVMPIDETFEVIDLMLVTTLEVINGNSRSRRKT